MPENQEKIGFFARDVYRLAYNFDCQIVLKELRLAFEEYLKTHPDLACVWYEMSLLYKDKKMYDLSVDTFRTKPNEIFESDSWKVVKPVTVAFIFKLEPLHIHTEACLMKALEVYLNENPQINLNDKHIIEAKNSIRFFTLSNKQIYYTNILTSEEKAALLYCQDNFPSAKEEKAIIKKIGLSDLRTSRKGSKVPYVRPGTMA